MKERYTIEYVREEFNKRGYKLLNSEYEGCKVSMLAETKDGYKITTNFDNLKQGRIPEIFSINNKYTIDNIKLWIKLNNKKYKLISKEYKGSKCNLEFLIEDDFVATSTWNNFQKGSIPSIFDKSNPNTLNNIKLFLKNNSKDYSLISKEYISSNSQLVFVNTEGYKMTSTWDIIRNGSNPSLFEKNNLYTIENIKLYLKLHDKDFELLSDKYINAFSELVFVNKEGYKGTTPWCNIQQGGNPLFFSNLNEYTTENIKTYIKNNNLEYDLMSNKFVSSFDKLTFYCHIHKKTFYISWNNFSGGQRCPNCSKDSNSGENHWNWQGGITNLKKYLRERLNIWKQDSFKLCNYRCDITGKNRNLIIHHLFGFKNILKETMETLNLPIYEEINQYTDEELKLIEVKCLELHYKYGLGICLCEEEHKRFHSMFGYNINTPEQYKSFKEIRLKELKIKEDLKVAN